MTNIEKITSNLIWTHEDLINSRCLSAFGLNDSPEGDVSKIRVMSCEERWNQESEG